MNLKILGVLAVILMVGSLFADGLTAGTLTDNKTITASDYSKIVSTKNGTYTNVVTLDKNIILVDTVANKIDPVKNAFILIDNCGAFDCEIGVNITPTKNLALDNHFIYGLSDDRRVSFDLPFIRQIKTSDDLVCQTIPDNKTGKNVTNCNVITTTTTVENRDISSITGPTTIILRAHRDNALVAADLGFSIFGQERWDAATWSASGGTKYTDGNYTVHVFTTNGTLAVTGIINATVLVVAGGGQGSYRGGGGGAGGLIYNDNYNATGNINVVVGQGGSGSTGAPGNNGTDSIFGTLVATGGGGGGKEDTGVSGLPGGSGGGAAMSSTVIAYGGQAVLGGAQGKSGGTSAVSGSPYLGSGGGGYATNGTGWSGSYAGNGGNGTNYSINGSNVYYAGGGGGSTYFAASGGGIGGLGGGGNGGSTAVPSGVPGTNGTGGGGGGSSNGQGGTVGQNGGSGIVIIRYLTAATPSVNVTSVAAVTTNGYNGTLVNFTIFATFVSTDASVQTVNISVRVNNTIIAWANNTQLNATGSAVISGIYLATRGSLDGNSTINMTAVGADSSQLNGSQTNTSQLFVPIDPPSAINLMSTGGKTRCRTPQSVGYWPTGLDWNTNATWGCNYTTNVTLPSSGIGVVDNGTVTFSNSNIIVNFVKRVIGDIGTAASIIFTGAGSALFK